LTPKSLPAVGLHKPTTNRNWVGFLYRLDRSNQRIDQIACVGRVLGGCFRWEVVNYLLDFGHRVLRSAPSSYERGFLIRGLQVRFLPRLPDLPRNPSQPDGAFGY